MVTAVAAELISGARHGVASVEIPEKEYYKTREISNDGNS